MGLFIKKDKGPSKKYRMSNKICLEVGLNINF